MGTVSSADFRPDPATTTVLLGVATVVAQSVLLREAMAAMGGSEVAWGLVMTLWLVGMGAGARTGVRLGSGRLAAGLPVITLVLACSGVLVFRAAPAILGATPGEAITTWQAVWLWALAIVPAAFAGGLAFPILAGDLGRNGPGRAYALEAGGALLGGIALSIALVATGTGAALLISLGFVSGATLWSRHRVLASLLVLACAAAAIPVGETLARRSWLWAGHPGALGHWTETRQQRLETSTGPPTALYADGRLVATYPDPYTTLPHAHLMLLLHPDPRRVLAIGCSADGSAEAMVQHEITELVLVDEDPKFILRLNAWYGEGFRATMSNPMVSLQTTDPLRAMKAGGDLDLVILAGGDPINLRSNRTRTVEFFRSCRSALKEDGILVMRVGVGDTYLGGAAGDLLATLARSLREVFPRVSAIPGESVLLVAGGAKSQLDTSIEGLVKRRLQRPVIGDQLPPAMLPVLLDVDRQTTLNAFVTSAERPTNTLQHPRAVPIAAQLHESRSRPAFFSFLAEIGTPRPITLMGGVMITGFGLLTLAFVGGPAIRATAAAAVVGFTSMGWWLLLLATWQMTRGSVYAEIGALTGVFMAGVAVGGWASHRRGRPRRALPWLLAAGFILSIVMATGAPAGAPRLLVPSLLVVGGLLTGAAFPGLGELASRTSGRRGAGLAFAADELGAAAAALFIGTVAIPWIGMSATAIGLAFLGLAAIPAVMRA